MSKKKSGCPTCGGKHSARLSCLSAWLKNVKAGK
jgi:hypothetical protein